MRKTSTGIKQIIFFQKNDASFLFIIILASMYLAKILNSSQLQLFSFTFDLCLNNLLDTFFLYYEEVESATRCRKLRSRSNLKIMSLFFYSFYIV